MNGSVNHSKEAVRRDAGSTARTIMYTLLFGFAFITLLAACGTADDGGSAHLHGSETWEETSSATTLPGFLDDHTQLSKDLYSEVHNHMDLMSGLPCYCGCMEGTAIDEPHDSLLRCYWAELPGDDGSVTWTDHSTGCGICKMEMEEVVALSKQGKTAEEILAAINAKFKPNKQAG
ncbi:hypothetical protein D3P08_07480 [Paenibacillus nanensis]|uniref:Uncharacterized protein n=1 Tax=Paenibacillus nanensis TaxID=393251 RepID=A0A3A1V0N0_9BACL|nr:PCYCGC motif-containing (lipo)protein [Paenibacillus nanensis]RIX54084.1 hypothetical protein D3P08_07480 [Paenibacillus nanensis]